MPVEVGIKVALSLKKESGESETKVFPVKDFQTPHNAGTPEFWEDVLGYIIRYRLRESTKQATLVAGSPEAKEAADLANKKLSARMKKDKKPKEEDGEPPAEDPQ